MTLWPAAPRSSCRILSPAGVRVEFWSEGDDTPVRDQDYSSTAAVPAVREWLAERPHRMAYVVRAERPAMTCRPVGTSAP